MLMERRKKKWDHAKIVYGDRGQRNDHLWGILTERGCEGTFWNAGDRLLRLHLDLGGRHTGKNELSCTLKIWAFYCL